jgi:hypothetical protein
MDAKRPLRTKETTMNPLIQLKQTIAIFLVAFGLVCFELPSTAQAVRPAPDGGYPGMNTAEGDNALLSLTTGVNNTAIGWSSLKSITISMNNTAVGAGSLLHNTANGNTATGSGALLNNISGYQNTADGAFALNHNNGFENTATGYQALYTNTQGDSNTATGYHALYSNTTGADNNAFGAFALFSMDAGDFNNAHGREALTANIDGQENEAFGDESLASSVHDSGNTAVGDSSLFSLNGGDRNTALGISAGEFIVDGSDNVCLGGEAGQEIVHASRVICIGAHGLDVSDTTWINNVYDVTTQSGITAPVIVSADGQLGTVASSERFKKDIATMGKASDSILALNPVTFHYKSDKTNTPQFGLIAEDVEKVDPDLVMRDKEGKPYSVRYDQVNAMLLNEFLKEHKAFVQEQRKVQEQGTVIARQQKQIESLAAGLQKVSAQLEMANPAPQTVLNNQ